MSACATRVSLVQVFLLYFTIGNFGGEHHVHGRLVFQFVERALQVLQRIATLLHDATHLRDDVEHIIVEQKPLAAYVKTSYQKTCCSFLLWGFRDKGWGFDRGTAIDRFTFTSQSIRVDFVT